MAEEAYEKVGDSEYNWLVEKGGKFLRVLSTRPYIRRTLSEMGYTQQDHNEGWELYLTSIGYRSELEPEKRGMSPLQRSAINALDEYDGPAFTRAEAALTRLHPEQEDYIFHNLKQASGVEAVGTVNLFLKRVTALRDGTDPSREKTRKADQAAVATLEKRKILTPEIETQLRQWIKEASELAPLPEVEEDEKFERERHQAARRFRSWLDDWRETARAGIKRRDYLIQLGLARRRRKKKEEVNDD